MHFETVLYGYNPYIEHGALSILGSNPARALENVAKHENFDLIVVRSRGLGSAASVLLGSVSKQVVVKAQCDFLVVENARLSS